MPNCDFYAVGLDHRAILEHLILQADCDLFESSSRADSELKQFHSIADFERHFSITDWRQGAIESISLLLYPRDANGALVKRRINFKPNSSHGATFKFCMEGWGLVQLWLEPIRNGSCSLSNTNHNSKKRAEAWSSTSARLGDPLDWDWKCVESFSRRLNRFIHKMAVCKEGSHPALPMAAQLLKLV